VAIAGAAEPEVDPDVVQLSGDKAIPTEATVVSVYDGDTLTLDTRDKVRLRWVNTPELRPMEDYGPEARDLAASLVLKKRVKLLTAGGRDGYGRLLSGVVVDGKNLSVALLEAGLGHLFVIPPDETDLRELVSAQERARAARRGIWSTVRYAGALHITSFHANAVGDDRLNVNGEYLRICNISSQPLDLSGYRIADVSGRNWDIPPALVPAGHTVKLHSGVGVQATDSAAQIELYLGSADPIWNNGFDRATIYDRYGRVVDSREHHAEKPNP
jgi:endonuclease YncB( thermonuclease family)